jgi:GT2 family glycosyltransferase
MTTTIVESSERDLHIVVVIPTHNRWKDAIITLAQLVQSKYQNFDVVLIEDGCVDGTAESCKVEFPDVHVLHGDGSLWWSGAINIGLDYALSVGADAVVWLNDDNRVEPDTLSSLVESFKRVGERSVICARVKSTLTGGDEWVGGPPRWHPSFGSWTPSDFSPQEVEVEYPPGGRGVLIPIQCFREVGQIDARSFPHYWADHDFHYRAMEAGYKYFLSTGAVVWNVPNPERKETPEKFSPRWAWWFLFDRRSPMNVVSLRRLLKRHLPTRNYRATYYGLLWRSLIWLASGWAARNRFIHRSLKTIRRSLTAGKQI